MPFGFHPAYLIILLAIALIIFGPSRLPQLGGAIGKTMKEFRKATDGLQDQVRNVSTEPAVAPRSDAGHASDNDAPTARVS
ncbi:MAG: twin-arginine translocase TatA/TatE family subunit [Candidatus Dormiibacterota bacterium]